MTRRPIRRAADAAGTTETAEAGTRAVKYVVARPYSAGEAPDIVDAEVTHEYEDEDDLLRLKLIDPPRGVDEDVKRVRRSDRREPGTWFEAPAEAAEVRAEPVAETPAVQEEPNGAGA
jgi:hypothetical protein